MNIIKKIFKEMEYGVYVDFNTKNLKIDDKTWDVFVINSDNRFDDPNVEYVTGVSDESFYKDLHKYRISTIVHFLSLETHPNSKNFLECYFHNLNESLDYKNVFVLVSVVNSTEVKNLLENNFYSLIHEDNDVSYYIHSFFNFLNDYE